MMCGKLGSCDLPCSVYAVVCRAVLCCVHAGQFLIGSVLSIMLWVSGAVKMPKLDAQTVSQARGLLSIVVSSCIQMSHLAGCYRHDMQRMQLFLKQARHVDP